MSACGGGGGGAEGGELFSPKYETPYMPYMPQISSASKCRQDLNFSIMEPYYGPKVHK